jgi:hypothetical protein
MLAAGVDTGHDVARAADGALLLVTSGLRVVRVQPGGAADGRFGVAEFDPANDSASDTSSVVSSALFGDGFEGAVPSVPAARRALGAGEGPRGP